LKSARRRRAIEVAGPRTQKERGQRTQGGQSITAWRGDQRTGREAFFVSALIRANPFDNQTQKVSLVVMHHRKTGTVLLDVFESAGGK
jgi:hypothetical protein